MGTCEHWKDCASAGHEAAAQGEICYRCGVAATATGTPRPLGSTAPTCSDAVMSAAYAFVDSMVSRADDNILDSPLWHGWALRDAFVAGATFKK
mgnify:CR=1 FL=1